MSLRFWAAVAAIATATGLAVRVLLSPQFTGLDDNAYLSLADRVAHGGPFPSAPYTYDFRVGTYYPLGWLVRMHALTLPHFWVLTILAEAVTFASLIRISFKLFNPRAAAVVALVYAFYPLAAAQSAMLMPTAFQSMAIALGLLGLAEADGLSGTRETAALFLAGVALGLGYLAHEAVAILVPVLAGAAIALGWKPAVRLLPFAAGAGLVFTVETATYAWLYRDPFERVLGARADLPTNETLKVALLWGQAQYARTLLIMPYKVGLHWWALAAAMIAVFRRGPRFVRLLAWSIVISMIYLQWGSNRFMTYSPMPKEPRYTVLVTPALALLLGWWLADLWDRGRRRLTGTTLAALVAAGLVCIAFAAISGNERMRNTLAVMPILEAQHIKRVYTDWYSARMLSLLSPSDLEVVPAVHAEFNGLASKTLLLVDPQVMRGSYVLVDRQACKIYTNAFGLPLPSLFANPPLTWRPIWRAEAYPEGGWARRVLDWIAIVNARVPTGRVQTRIRENVDDMTIADDAVLYFVPQ